MSPRNVTDAHPLRSGRAVVTPARLVWALVLAAVVLASLPLAHELWFFTSTDDASIEGRHTMLAPKVAGIVLEVLFDDNEEVHEGQPLVRIDPRDYQHALQMTQAQLAINRAHLKDAQLKYDEAVSLYGAGAINGQQKDSAESVYMGLKADKERLEALLAQNHVDLDYATVVAPKAGRVGRRIAEPGMYAHAGQPLVSFVAANERWVVANFKETQIRHTPVGAHAEVRIDALPGKVFDAVVQTMSPNSGAVFSLLPPDNATGNYIKIVQRVPVKLLFAQLSAEELNGLQVGLNATVRIPSGR
jgi:membrane fusion protein (multidrug efflux system)